mgnify:CR=1 FL=1
MRLRERLSFAFMFLAFFTLVDEYVKEGYLFDFRDVFSSFPTHEQLFLAFLLSGLLLGLKK